MREFIGHTVSFAVQEMGVVKGVVVNDAKDRILIKGDDGGITRIVKSHICAFTPIDFEPEDYVPFLILHCWNKKTGCPGVKFVHEGQGFKATDFEAFMAPCPCRRDDCTYGSKGEIHSVSGSFLRDTFADTIYGEYPENKEVDKSGNRTSRKSSGETQHSQSEGAGVVAGEEQDNGRTGCSEEATD